MARIEIGRYLAVDTRVCGGHLIFRSTRIPVSDVLELVQVGYSPKQVAKQYRGLITSEAVSEAVSLARQGFVREVFAKTKRA